MDIVKSLQDSRNCRIGQSCTKTIEEDIWDQTGSTGVESASSQGLDRAK